MKKEAHQDKQTDLKSCEKHDFLQQLDKMSYDDKSYRLDDFEFVWHIPKANSNLADHGVSFEEGAEVFLDPYKTMIGIRKTDYGEVRPAVVGMVRNVPLLVVYTLRNGRIRIISVRKAHKNERKKYRGIQA